MCLYASTSPNIDDVSVTFHMIHSTAFADVSSLQIFTTASGKVDGSVSWIWK